MILHMDNVLIGGDPYNTEFNGAGDCELQKKLQLRQVGSALRDQPHQVLWWHYRAEGRSWSDIIGGVYVVSMRKGSPMTDYEKSKARLEPCSGQQVKVCQPWRHRCQSRLVT